MGHRIPPAVERGTLMEVAYSCTPADSRTLACSSWWRSSIYQPALDMRALSRQVCGRHGLQTAVVQCMCADFAA